jgi:predicted RNA-binding Zn ribbon-like protein
MEAAEPRFRQGAGRISLDFIRTLRYRGRPGETEELPDEAALDQWLRQFGPAIEAAAPEARAPETGPRPGPAELAGARRLREAVYTLVTAARDGSAAPPAARETVNAAAEPAGPVPRLAADGQLSWHAADPVGAVLALVARDGLDLVTSPALGRLRSCANPDCRVLFLDSSRPGARRWCDMNTCGNQAKKAVFRGKR